MLANNYFGYSLKIITEMLKDVLMFPFWWYSRGLINTVIGQIEFLKNQAKVWSLMVWVKNLLRPMFGVTDWQGKLISFFMRLFQIIFRSLVMLLWAVWSVIVIIFWIVFPLFVIYEIIFQIHV